MIIYRKGDVVEAFKNGEIDVLVHGVNCQGKMNSGIAKQIRTEFPEVFEEYLRYVNFNVHYHRDYGEQPNYTEILGDIDAVRIGKTFQFIVNAFTQDNYGYGGERYCSYDAIDKVMKEISKYDSSAIIAMPKIGAGLGGGDWKVIEAIINSHFQDRDVFVYTLEELPKRDGRNDYA